MDTLTTSSDVLEHAVVVVGTIAFAISGAVAAQRRRMDWFGAIVLAVIVAIGGGTLRDLLLDLPVNWIDDPWPLAVAAVTAALYILLVTWFELDPGSWKTLELADAAGLAAFTMLGTDIALAAGTSSAVAVILGVVTGVGGGIIRDVLAGDIPLVFSGEIYALAAVAGSIAHVALVRSDLSPVVTWWLPVLLIFGLRLVAVRRRWSLPTIDREIA
jgi:uncharacterized membrane protein YeiH